MGSHDIWLTCHDAERKAALVAVLEANKYACSDDYSGQTGICLISATGQSHDGFEAAIEAAAREGTPVLALFEAPPHGVSFADYRAHLSALGAHHTLPANASEDDVLASTRALFHQLRPPRVLVVEDEPDVGAEAVSVLEDAGMDAVLVTSLAGAIERFEAGPVDALIVDRGLPDGDGLDLVAKLRARGIRTPALFYSSWGDLNHRLDGLNTAGADDYICKPVHGEELVARVNVKLRIGARDQTMIFGPLTISRTDRSVKWRDEPIPLPRREREMLIYLAERADIPIPQRMLYRDVWGLMYMNPETNPVTMAKSRLAGSLRKAITAQGDQRADFIETVGNSYVFRPKILLALDE